MLVWVGPEGLVGSPTPPASPLPPSKVASSPPPVTPPLHAATLRVPARHPGSAAIRVTVIPWAHGPVALPGRRCGFLLAQRQPHNPSLQGCCCCCCIGSAARKGGRDLPALPDHEGTRKACCARKGKSHAASYLRVRLDSEKCSLGLSPSQSQSHQPGRLPKSRHSHGWAIPCGQRCSSLRLDVNHAICLSYSKAFPRHLHPWAQPVLY